MIKYFCDRCGSEMELNDKYCFGEVSRQSFVTPGTVTTTIPVVMSKSISKDLCNKCIEEVQSFLLDV